MMNDPYKVLGVAPGASPEEIKTAYRTLAKRYHPDLHPDDAAAAEKMNEINVAYDILSKPHTASFERLQARERAYEQRTYQQAYQQTYQQSYAEQSYQQEPEYEYESPFGNNTQWQWQWQQSYSPYQRNHQEWTPAPVFRITLGRLIKWFIIWQVAAAFLKLFFFMF